MCPWIHKFSDCYGVFTTGIAWTISIVFIEEKEYLHNVFCTHVCDASTTPIYSTEMASSVYVFAIAIVLLGVGVN